MFGSTAANVRARLEGRGFAGILYGSAKSFAKDKCTMRAAALCYATIFALPPLLIVLIKLAGVVWSPDDVQHAIESEFAALIGSDGARAVQDMVTSASHTGRGWIAATYGVIGLVIGATGEFLSLQGALNAVWGVEPDKKQGGVRRFIGKRLLSLAMTMGVAFLLVVSLALTAAIAALVHSIGDVGWVLQALNSIVALATLSVLFAAMFKFLPDAEIAWRSVWIGGIATAVLFEVGKFVIGLYLSRANPGNPFGAARSFAGILVWIYYAGLLVLFGAEFTEKYAKARGHPVRPKNGAVETGAKERLVPEPSRDGRAAANE